MTDEVVVRRAKNGVVIVSTSATQDSDEYLVVGGDTRYRAIFEGDVGKAVVNLLFGEGC